MLNLIRSDLFKLRKAKYFWVLLVINILLAVGTVCLLDFTYKLAGDSMEAQLTQEQAALDDAGMNVSVEGIPTGHDELSASSQMLTFFASLQNTGWLVTIRKRVELSPLWLMPSASTFSPFCFPASTLAMAAWDLSPSSATFLAATAVFRRLTCLQSRWKSRYLAHCISPWGWE